MQTSPAAPQAHERVQYILALRLDLTTAQFKEKTVFFFFFHTEICILWNLHSKILYVHANVAPV